MKSKTLITLFIIIFTSFNLKAQYNIGDIVSFKTHTKQLSNKTNDKIVLDNEKVYLLEPNVKFRIIEINENNFVITALLFNSPKKRNDDKIDKALIYNYKIFEVEKNEFLTKAILEESQNALSVGVVSLPLKFRPQSDFGFDTAFNINASASIRVFRLFNSSMNFQFGSGIGNTNLNVSNSSGIVEGGELNANILSAFGGLMYQYKRAQVGIYIGTDFINNQNYYQWDHHGKLWCSLGIGYDIFRINIGNKQKENNK